MWESWVVLAIFILNLAFMLIMSFASPFFKEVTSRGIGKIFNIVWICVIIGAAGILMFYNVRCLNPSADANVIAKATGKVGGEVAEALNSITSNCKMLSISIIVFLSLLTILNMSWTIYNTIEYNKKSTTINVTQEHKQK